MWPDSAKFFAASSELARRSQEARDVRKSDSSRRTMPRGHNLFAKICDSVERSPTSVKPRARIASNPEPDIGPSEATWSAPDLVNRCDTHTHMVHLRH